MESFHDYRMVNNCSIVEQVHEVQCIVKDLEQLKCELPDKFVARYMIAKLPSTWSNFSTTLKHRRKEISVENLIASLDVEEKARMKDVTDKRDRGQSSANMVQKFPRNKNKGENKVVKTTTFKKKKMNKYMDNTSGFSSKIIPEPIASIESSEQFDKHEELIEKYDNADDWKEAVHNEMDLILSNGTWELTERPYGCKLVGCKWVFKNKLRPDDTIEKYKARLMAKGFVINEVDRCVYYRHGGGEEVILCLYMDDILLFDTNIDVINEVKCFLSKSFDTKDLGEADVILNIKLIKDKNGITLSQFHYVEKILNHFGYMDSKLSPTPYDPILQFRKNKKIVKDQLRYS
ncbi:uncharacterized protein LOC111257306 [Setaria italica]|uniref:uncharacterized protein LOC111257306 n=1 Tax=Setaria italica TaxID=4555 RepID=UPI000BE56C92|nr:uncharacterized protein LOC111257306 [Setaria italica]